MIEVLVAAVLAFVAYLVGSRRGKKSEQEKQADAYQKRKDRIDEAGNDTSGLDRDQLNDRLRKATRK